MEGAGPVVEMVVWLFRAAMAGDSRSVLLLVCVYAVLLVGWSLLYQRRVAGWPCVRGTLCRDGLRSTGGPRAERRYLIDARYRYEVDGTVYRGRKLSLWSVSTSHNVRGMLHLQWRAVERAGDGTVNVYYHRAKPYKSVLVRPGPGSALATIVATWPVLVHLTSALLAVHWGSTVADGAGFVAGATSPAVVVGGPGAVSIPERSLERRAARAPDHRSSVPPWDR